MVESGTRGAFPILEELDVENGRENIVCTELGQFTESSSRASSVVPCSERADGRRNVSTVSLFDADKYSDNGFILRDNRGASTVSGGKLKQSKRPHTGGDPSRRSFWKSFRNVVRFRNAVDKKRKISKPIQRRDSFMERFTTRQREMAMQDAAATFDSRHREGDDTQMCGDFLVVHPDENFNFYWSMVVSAAIVYNMWLIIARQAWLDLQNNFRELWLTLDYVSDFIYLLDIGVQLRLGYLEQGMVVRGSKKLAMHYVKSRAFKLDVATLLPLDLLYLVIGRVAPMLRFPRFLKVYRFRQFYYMEESRTAQPNIWRVINLTHLLFLLIHWFAAIYYLISESMGFASDTGDQWAYPQPVGEYAGLTRKYLWCVYWSTLTLTTIGDLPSPVSNWEYLFQTCSYLIGVFVFATIVGQVGTVVENRNASRLDFEKHLDNTKQYMRTHNVPEDVQRRVQRWYDYTWARGHLTGGGDLSNLSLLPEKMKTELALHVNLETLRKVTIFHECPPEFLHDLVLKMKAFIFTPGDLICRKGEIAREMFIIADGILEVTSDVGEVFTTLKAGDFFGEIGVLNLDQESGANKRTADVRSVGYSELFTLSKDDVLTAIKDFPQAQKILEEFGRKRLKHKRSNSKDNDDEVGAEPASSNDSQPIVGVTIEGTSTAGGGLAFETTIEPIMESDFRRWSMDPDSFRPAGRMSELEAPVITHRRGSDSSDLSAAVRLITEVYPSPVPSDVESRQSEVLKKKLKIRRSGKRRTSNKSSSGNDDELECQIADISLRVQSLLHKKLGKHYQETEQLRLNLQDSENHVAALESLNQRKNSTIAQMEERIKVLELEGKHGQETGRVRLNLQDSERRVAALESENRRKDAFIAELEERIRTLVTTAAKNTTNLGQQGPHRDGDDNERRPQSSRMSNRSVELLTVVSN